MNKFWIVTLFQTDASLETREKINQIALENFHALGIEEFAMDEAEVDELLGERSYSGGDLPESVLGEVEEHVFQKPSSIRFFFEKHMDATEFAKILNSEILAEIQIEERDSEDWNAEWKKHYSPIKVNTELEIIPSWMKDFSSTSRQVIFIYPGMGFGTGSHETTFLCLKLFTEHKPQTLQHVLDFGSGSGILGLSVFKFFPAAEVDFYDIDPDANKNCYQNAELNKLEEHSFRLLLPEFRNKLLPGYDLIFANILENVLVLEKDFLCSALRPGGLLILSGLLGHQAQGIIQTYATETLELVQRQDKRDWTAILFRRKN
jgi:ribosomal protein L11 methyltransferase